MNRQSFIRNSMLASAALMLGTERSATALSSGQTNASAFRMKFSPEFDIFNELGGKDVIDQIKWGHDNGFRAWENTFLARRPVAEQERISKTVQQLGMEFGQFVGTLNFKDATFASRNKAIRDNVLQEVKASIEIAKRMNTKYIHNVLGMSDPKITLGFSDGECDWPAQTGC